MRRVETSMQRTLFTIAVALAAAVTVTAAAEAQTGATLRVIRPAVVLEQPRGDSIRIASVQPGQVLEILDQNGSWYLVEGPQAAAGKPAWNKGWIHASFVQLVNPLPARGRRRPAGTLMIRGFGHAGGTLWDAQDSFDTIVGSPFGSVFGGGAQVVLPSGAFVQVSVDRFRETGTRALVSGTRIFTLQSDTQITVMPILATAGFRSAAYGRVVPYGGAGVGWHRLTEEAPLEETVTRDKVGFHVLGGAEIPVLPWVSVAGEVQWATVPKALGETGVSAVFGEKDLGGTTFLVKLILGR